MNNNTSNPPYTNRLIHETSPYLLQHAHNPVNWYAWGDEALKKANDENKCILVSIGYSACHWCHVMEHEVFEHADAAEIMNEHFVCIKIDREERPDIDQIYMDALQLMSGRGGWPLNVFTLPDGRPVYGGTYIPKDQWINVCSQLADLHENEPQRMVEYAQNLTLGIQQLSQLKSKENVLEPHTIQLDSLFRTISARFDPDLGGTRPAPKFPMPVIYDFLLHYTTLSNNDEALSHTELTLHQMAWGGIYDQLGGGFARYSVDAEWKVPHFEKMLYDNAQLVSVYAKAYALTNNPLYRRVVYETIAFVERDLYRGQGGGFYAALDADSEGEEGKFYVWTEEEIQSLLDAPDVELLMAHFGVRGRGKWEEDTSILVLDQDAVQLAYTFGVSVGEVNERLQQAKNQLLEARNKRIKPSLDNKILTSWNALMISGLLDAYRVFGEQHFLDLAYQNWIFLESNLLEGTTLKRTYKQGVARIDGFLEDYALLIQALISFHQTTLQESFLLQAQKLTTHVLDNFYDSENKAFVFTSKLGEQLIANKIDLADNVIPSPNSVMAHNLFLLGKLLTKPEYLRLSHELLNHAYEPMLKFGSYYSNWARLYAQWAYPFYEIVVVGTNALSLVEELKRYVFFNVVFVASTDGKSDLECVQYRYQASEMLIYICSNNTCQRPVKTLEEALVQLGLKED